MPIQKALKIKSSPDCNKIIVSIPPRLYGGGAQRNSDISVKISNLDSFYEYTIDPSDENKKVITTNQIGGDKHGVFMVEIIVDGVAVAKSAVLLACDVLCCIASKMEELLDCDCDCNKCSEHFVEAQKIFLLVKSAEAQLAGLPSDFKSTLNQKHAIIESAREKYKTAQDMCAGHCGCNC